MTFMMHMKEIVFIKPITMYKYEYVPIKMFLKSVKVHRRMCAGNMQTSHPFLWGT